MTNDLIAINDLERMAVAVAKSKLFGVKTAEEAMTLMLVAQAEGMHPMTAVQQFDIIQGKPARKSWAMLDRFQQAGGKVEWHERGDQRADATFSHPLGGTVRVDWDMVRAKKAGLAGKEMWAKYPRQMLTARVISEGVRTVYPGATGGFYTPEEARDMEPPPMRDVTPKAAPKPTLPSMNGSTSSPPAVAVDAVLAATAGEPFDLEADASNDYAMHWPAIGDTRDVWKAAAKRALQVVREMKEPNAIYAWQTQNIDGLRMLHAAASDLHDWMVDKITMHANSLGGPEA